MEFNILNLGAGVQSTAVALLMEKGDLPKPDIAIFSDTKWEPKKVYEHLAWLESVLSFPVARVSKGDLRKDLLSEGRFVSIPGFVRKYNDGNTGILRRQCTKEYKIEPIEKYVRYELLGLKPRQKMPKDIKVNFWFGISSDEAQRMKTPRVNWQEFHYPLCGMPELLEPVYWSRLMCMKWLEENYPEKEVPRSACIGCPYHTNMEWRKIRDEHPEEWKDVVDFDKEIRSKYSIDGEVYLHRSLKPLDEVDLSTEEERGQLSLFGNECDGMCGV